MNANPTSPIEQPSTSGRRSSPHFFLAVLSLVCAIATFNLTIWAYYDEGSLSTHIAFGSAIVTAAALFLTWFWGVFLLMSGVIPQGTILFLAAHALAGSLIPLLYVMDIGFAMQRIGSQPLNEIDLASSFIGMIALVLQFVSGRLVIAARTWRGTRRTG